MIIVSQDKDNIVNFDNTVSIGIEDFDGLPGNWQRISAETLGTSIVLGDYKTEERAKEVLEEIVSVMSEEEYFHINKSTLNNLDELSEPKYILRPVSRKKVYFMPEE